MELPKPGLYRHRDGDEYQVLMLGEDSTNPPDGGPASHEPVVIYVPLGKWRGKVCTRLASQWSELVEWADGRQRPRFEPVVR